MAGKARDNYKDNIFRYLFSDENNFVELYYDLTGRRLNVEDLEFYDTESVIVAKELKNDIAFKTKDNRLIIMVEHQSTLNENMPLRFLMYYVELLKVLIKQESMNVYSRKALNLPDPEFYVVYNGLTPLEYSSLDLKKSFNNENSFINLKVDIVNINYEKLPENVKKRNDILDGYSFFVEKIRYYHKDNKLPLLEALEKAKDETYAKGYLQNYLKRKEFVTMVLKVLTIEEEMELIRQEESVWSREEGRIIGRKEGRKEGHLDVARNLIGKLDDAAIASATGLTIEEVKALKH